MKKVEIELLATGVPGLDTLLGGGVPEFSFNLLAGTPGSGKTTLAHQIMFSLANPNRRALFFTVLGEPPLKMLRYQQQFSFFDFDKVNDSIKFVNLAADLLQGDFERVLARIDEEVKAFEPSLVFVDSFRSVVQTARAMDSGVTGLQHFVQHLGMQMTSWLATTFLIGEYLAPESESSPVFTVADGILWMSQLIHRDALVRKIQVVKMRGQAQRLGVHTFRINSDGVEIFPRMVVNPMEDAVPASEHLPRLPLGNATLDEMMGGGLPTGYSLLVVGPSGSGKTVLASAFLAEGVQHGETGVIAAFEKSSRQLRDQRLSKLVADGHIGVINTRTLDLSLDEILHELVAMIVRMDAKRVVIDSISGLEMALAPMFREDFKESLYRLIATLSAMGVTVLMTVELEDCNNALSFNSHGYAFLGDAIVMQRYVETAGELKRALSVIKVRGSGHSKEIRAYEISDAGISIGAVMTDHEGVMSGRPVRLP